MDMSYYHEVELWNPHSFDLGDPWECPECPADMKLKYGKYGPFLGRENFPLCTGHRRYWQEYKHNRKEYENGT